MAINLELKALIIELFYAAQAIPELNQLIIYGSIARGEEDKRSDVDLLLIFDSEEDPEKTELAKIAHQEIGRAFARSKCERNPQLIFTNLKNLDKGLLENISREGIIIYGKPRVIDASQILRPANLYEYRVGGESKVEKVQFYRALKTIEGKKLKSSIIVTEEKSKEAEDIFKRNKIKYEKKKLWI